MASNIYRGKHHFIQYYHFCCESDIGSHKRSLYNVDVLEVKWPIIESDDMD